MEGLESLLIVMSKADVNKVFSFLDPEESGYFTYLDFCKLNQDKRPQSTLETGGRTIGELHNNNGHMLAEA